MPNDHRSPRDVLDELAHKTPKNERATVRCGTTVRDDEGLDGHFEMEFNREWSPFGYDKAVLLFEEVRASNLKAGMASAISDQC
jgi:hypothetical protein